MTIALYLRKTVSVFFEYDTPRYVHINSKKVGIFSRVIQLIILSYIVGYVLIYQKGYQDTDVVDSTIVTKVKGVTYTNFTDEELQVPHPELYNRRIWDPSDYVTPPGGNENGGFFIMTNVVITPNQTKGVCPEDTSIIESVCKDDNDCELGRSLEVGNGVQTGKCVPSVRNSTINTCEIYAWCPVEQDILPFNSTRALLEDSQKYTVLIKNTIAFLKFGPQYLRRNVLEDATSTYLQKCVYNRKTDPFCPVFRIGDILEWAGNGGFNSVALQGGVYVIRIKWNCNLDWDFMKYCKPHYEFQRMDNPEAQIAPGWNFRSANYHEENRRTLYKRYGLKFVIEVDGHAGKFSIIPLLLNVGSGLALMGLATVVCDIIVLYLLKNGRFYKDKKYLNVRGDDAFDINPLRAETDPRNYARFHEGENGQGIGVTNSHSSD